MPSRRKRRILTVIDTANPQGGFADLGIAGALLKALAKAGFSDPKPIQNQA
ncbi:MAG: ATP-dependent helicase, partial [Nitratireductor sp.]